MPKIFDISPKIRPGIAVFPGDTEFSQRVLLSFEQGHALRLSSIQSTVHLGAHVDAPNHYHPKGLGISERDLSYYYGRAQVITVLDGKDQILEKEFVNAKIAAPRILLRTNSYPDPYRWSSEFRSLSTDAIDYLADSGVRLIGIDTPSIDPAEAKDLISHRVVFKRDMAILEGIVLDGVPDGIYTLFALPLPIEGADASPVRAVLFEGDLGL